MPLDYDLKIIVLGHPLYKKDSSFIVTLPP